MLLICNFSKPLIQEEFDYWVRTIWSDDIDFYISTDYQIYLGKNRVRTYGHFRRSEHHINIELSDNKLIAMCVNTEDCFEFAESIRERIDAKAEIFYIYDKFLKIACVELIYENYSMKSKIQRLEEKAARLKRR